MIKNHCIGSHRITHNFLLMIDNELSGQAGNDHNDHHPHYNDDEIRNQLRFNDAPGIEQTRCRRNKHNRHGFNQESHGFTNLYHVQYLKPEHNKQEKNPVNAGRNRKRKQSVQNFTDKCQCQNNTELSQYVHD